MNEPIVEPILAVEAESSFKTNAPLIPGDSVAGRALVVVIAIMTFLACLTAGAALLVADASQAWRSDVLREATIQVKSRAGDDVESLVAKAVAIATKTPGVESVHAYPRPNWRSFSSHGSARGSTSVSCPSRGLSLSNFAASVPKTSRRCVQRSPQPFPRRISTTIGCGRRASAPWPMPSSFLPPLFSC